LNAFTGCNQKEKQHAVRPVFKKIPFANTIDSSAVSILERSRYKYSTLVNYFDSGKVISSFYNIPHPIKKALYYKTSFSKSGLFNFEYYEPGRSNTLYEINRGNGRIRSWWGVTNKLKEFKSIRQPLTEAAGVSSSLSLFIPGLLLQEDFPDNYNILNRLREPVLLNTEMMAGHECYKISETDTLTKKMILWIDKKDFLIRGIETLRTVKDFKVLNNYIFNYSTSPRADKHIFDFIPHREVEL
jgi:outer membrane lipoprotein-sorting protein